MPKVIVNDRQIEVPNGASALDAVFQAGFDVPYFCSNEYLSPIGACRMCLVEAGSPRKNPDGSWIMDDATGKPKLFFFPGTVASCTLATSEGMVIKTTTDAAVKAQAGMMEFTLINHPLDCPTCDKGGACELQDRAYEYGYGEARFEFTRRHADKHHALSDFIVLDKERCIHCKRCVRYFEEIPGEEVLDFIERGGHTFIDSYQSEDLAGAKLGNFSGNINDLCPVGALLDNVSRFRGRNWEYDRTQTTDLTNADGACIWVDARTGRIERIRAAHNKEVNEIWISDAQRFGHEWVDADARVRTPLVRKNGKLEPATFDEAVEVIRAKNLEPSKLGLYTSADITLEEGAALESFAKTINTINVDHFPRYNAPVGSATRATFTDLAKADAVVVIGADLYEESGTAYLRIEENLKGVLTSDVQFNHGTALADLRLKERMDRKRSKLAVFAPVPVKQMSHAGIVGLYGVGSELELLAQIMQAKSGNDSSSPAANAAGKLLSNAKNPVIVLGSFALATDAEKVLLAAKKTWWQNPAYSRRCKRRWFRKLCACAWQKRAQLWAVGRIEGVIHKRCNAAKASQGCRTACGTHPHAYGRSARGRCGSACQHGLRKTRHNHESRGALVASARRSRGRRAKHRLNRRIANSVRCPKRQARGARHAQRPAHFARQIRGGCLEPRV